MSFTHRKTFSFLRSRRKVALCFSNHCIHSVLLLLKKLNSCGESKRIELLWGGLKMKFDISISFGGVHPMSCLAGDKKPANFAFSSCLKGAIFSSLQASKKDVLRLIENPKRTSLSSSFFENSWSCLSLTRSWCEVTGRGRGRGTLGLMIGRTAIVASEESTREDASILHSASERTFYKNK